MINIKIDELKRTDIGRTFTTKDYTGVLANYSIFKEHAELVFEDGKRKEMSASETLQYDDSVEVRLTASEIEILLKNHPYMISYQAQLESYNTQKRYLTGRASHLERPVKHSKIVRLEKLLESINR